MLPFLFVILMFGYCWLVGLGLLALLGGELSDLRVALTAPVLGTCVTLLPAFVFSEAGLAVGSSAIPIAIVLAVSSLTILGIRRPRIHPTTTVVAGMCVAGALLIAWPLFSFGFHWFANGNDDMANYVLSAQDLLTRGLLAPIDFSGLLHGRDYASILTVLNIEGSRPGSGILLAFASSVLDHPPYEIFMPVIVAVNLCGACAVGALALQFTRRRYAAILAAGLLLISPLASYGVLQQLFAQVWGLAVAAGLLALLLRAELHGGDRKVPSVGRVVEIGVLVSGLCLVYPELIPEIALAYVLYVALLASRGQVRTSVLARLWVPSIAVAVVIMNLYIPNEIRALHHQVTTGLGKETYPPLFGYAMVPAALPGILGLQTLPPGGSAPLLGFTIVLAILAIAALVVVIAVQAWKTSAAAIVLLVMALLGVVLALRNSDFGVFKLTMYVQPFIAAVIAALIARKGAGRLLTGLSLALIFALAIAQVSTQQAYVGASRNPEDAPNVSAADVIPAFHSLASHPGAIVSVTTNPALLKLEAASAENGAVFFQSRDAFSLLLSEFASTSSGATRSQILRYLDAEPWVKRSFNLHNGSDGKDTFEEDAQAARELLTARNCELVLPGRGEEPLNRYSLDTDESLVALPCASAHDLLAFTDSNLGEGFYLPKDNHHVSYYQLQGDPYFPDQMVGFGRYGLFQVIGPSPGERMVIELTDTLNHDGINRLPPAAVVGTSRDPLPLEGLGSARVFSAPVSPQVINGLPYILLDMGVNGHLPTSERGGLESLYGASVPLDPRYLTSYVRDISLISAQQYADLRPPLALSSFPASLENPDLEYSGLYEDGWVGAESFVKLAGGPGAELVVKGEVPAGAGKNLLVLINGEVVDAIPIEPGALDVHVPVAASHSDRRVELRFGATIHLKPPDLRPAAARLTFLGLVDRG